MGQQLRVKAKRLRRKRQQERKKLRAREAAGSKK
jgi:hypothetical protein